MKNIILVGFLLGISSSAFTQHMNLAGPLSPLRLDTVVAASRPAAAGSRLIAKSFWKRTDSSTWNALDSTLYFFTDNTTDLHAERAELSGYSGSMQNQSYFYNKYNSNGQLVNELKMRWSNGSYDTSNRRLLVYNSAG